MNKILIPNSRIEILLVVVIIEMIRIGNVDDENLNLFYLCHLHSYMVS